MLLFRQVNPSTPMGCIMSQSKPAAILRYFSYVHLAPLLRDVSEKCYTLADDMDNTLPECAEKSAGLRKLLEAKDCFVRAQLENK